MSRFCDGKGSVNTFSCYYTTNLQEISMTGWSLQLNPDPEFLALRGKCMLKTVEPKSCDALMSYFTRGVVETQPRCATCRSLSQWKLHVLASPVSIVVERIIQTQDVVLSSWEVTVGQRIRLTCVSTCSSNPGPNEGYNWYKDDVRLHEGGAGSSHVLLLDPASPEHEGRYVCTSFGHELSPSSPVSLTVLAEIRPLHSDTDPSPPESVPEVDSSHGSSSISLFCIVLVVAVCCGLVVVTAVGIITLQKRREQERRQMENQKEEECGADAVSPGSDCHVYMSLDVSSQRGNLYEGVGNVQRCSDSSSNYENES